MLDSVDLRFQILNPAGNCVLYEEVQSGVNLSASKGAFSLSVGSVLSDAKRSANFRGAYNPSMISVFRNGATLSGIPVTDCAAGTYVAGSADTRLLRVHVTKGGTTETLSPDLVINTVPSAQVAASLQGFLPSDFLRLDLANGISGNIGLTAIGAAAGQTREFRFYELAANGAEYSAFKAPDVMATSLTYVLPSAAPAAGDILKATVPSSGVVTLSWGADAGAGGGISNLNGSSQSSQSFAAVDIAAGVTAPAWSTNAGTGAHTLQIPMAFGAGVTGGLITKTEHSAFTNKVDRAGDTMTGPLAMGTNKITGVGDPTAAQEAATKAYVDAQDSGKISGALTATRIPFASGASTLTDAANFTYNSTTGAMGIGGTSPSITSNSALTISAGGTNQNVILAPTGSGIVNSGNPFGGPQFLASNSGYKIVVDASNGYIGMMASQRILWNNTAAGSFYSVGSPDIGFARNSAGVVEVNNGTVGTFRDIQLRAINPASGNVGVGTVAPNGKLHVSTASGLVPELLILQNAHVGLIQDQGTGLSFMQSTVGSGSINTAWSNAADSDNTYMTFATRGSGTVAERVRIAADGNVGIGTTTPAAKLDITGNMLISGTINGTSVGGGPNAFSFTNQTGVNIGATIQSNAVTLAGFTGLLPAACTGCVAIVRNGISGSTTAAFLPGDTIALQVLSSSSATTAVTASVTIGATTSSTWSVTTGAVATNTPDAFSFTNQTNVVPNSAIISNIVVISGFTGTVTATCNGGCSDISINGVWAGATSVGGVLSGNQIRIKQTSSASTSTATTGSVTVGSTTSGTWSVTTSAAADPCTGSPSIGTTCADGTVYAGLTPDGNVKMYTTPCDLGMSWNGTVCTGVRSTTSWNDGSSNYVSTSLTSEITGQSNTATLVAYGTTPSPAPYQAARSCGTLSANGRSDWYLPARNELNVLYTNRASLTGFETSGSFYWSSSEVTVNWVRRQRFSDGITDGANKETPNPVRCVRR